MFYLDIDEIDTIAKSIPFISRNTWNIFSFRDTDHLVLSSKNIKENIKEYLQKNGIDFHNGKIMLLTHLRTFGYVFNPVSFYFCFNEKGEPLCAIPEVGNTFRELKPYLIKKEDLKENIFQKKIKKYFYVSPFIELDTEFDFILPIPNEKLAIHINDYKNGEKFFISSLAGIKKTLNTFYLFYYLCKFPFITLKVITLIHWQAIKLYFKKLPYLKKEKNKDMQKEVYSWKT